MDIKQLIIQFKIIQIWLDNHVYIKSAQMILYYMHCVAYMLNLFPTFKFYFITEQV